MPPIDPATIEAILAILIPMIQDCLANRKTEQEVVSMLVNPNRRQRFVLFFALHREQRKALRVWRSDKDVTHDWLEESEASELVQIAIEEAACNANATSTN